MNYLWVHFENALLNINETLSLFDQVDIIILQN